MHFLSLSSGNGSMTAREALGPLRQAVDTILALDPRVRLGLMRSVA